MSTPTRPYVLLSVAASVDSCIDDNSDQRLLLSNAEDFDRVDAERAGCDAILVGANTIRRDNPRLLVRSDQRVADRLARGLPPSPLKVTLTGSAELDPSARFFTAGDVEKLVYTAGACVARARTLLGSVATVVDAGDPVDPARVLEDLSSRGVQRLMVEGGTSMHTLFLTRGLVDELQLVVAPFFIGDPDAPHFTGRGTFPQSPSSPMRLLETRVIGDCVLLRYALTDRAVSSSSA